MAKKANPNNTVESVLGRCGIPRAKTVNTYKRCMGALTAVSGDVEQAVENLTEPGFFSTRKILRESSVRYYVNGCNRLSAAEQKRLQNLSATAIIVNITRSKK